MAKEQAHLITIPDNGRGIKELVVCYKFDIKEIMQIIERFDLSYTKLTPNTTMFSNVL